MKKATENNTAVLETKRTDLMLVDPRNLIIEVDFNVRKDMGDIHGLALSIVRLGVEEPLIGHKVRGEDTFIVTDGHRRESAIKLALELHAKGYPQFADISKIKFVPVRNGSSNPLDRLYTMAVTGEKKKNLNDMERATMYQRLIDMIVEQKSVKRGLAIKEIAESVGVSLASLYNVLKLNELDKDIQDFVASGQLSGATAVTIVKDIADPEEQKKAVLDAVYNAEEKSKATGSKVKATAANVKGLKAKTAIQKLKEVAEKLEAKDVKNIRTKLLAELIEALDENKTINVIVGLFL